MGAAAVAALSFGRPVAAQASLIEAPRRISKEQPPVARPTPVPASAATLPSLTFVLETTRVDPRGTHRTTQTITRTPNRIRVELPGGRQEWVFVRNLVYGDRASAYLIDHDAREIRFHDEGPLRSRLGIHGWMDVLTIRFDPGVLASLRQTGERRDAGGAPALRFVAREPREDGIAEVWWSDELLLPLSVTRRLGGAETTSVVARLSRTEKPILLADPGAMFPEYKDVDAADAGDH